MNYFLGSAVLLVFADAIACWGQVASEIHHFIPDRRYCLQCHSEPFKSAAEFGVLDRVQLSEWKQWEDRDKHTTAYEILSGERSQRMARLLQKDVFDPGTGCVQCHTANVDEQLWSAECNLGGQNDCQIKGVACQSCHGPAEHWVGVHDKPQWRMMSAADKQALGFTLLENPKTRAAKCLSCHLGSTAENRVITHKMYAAGHPPLSGFEMESFADKMPRHWRYQNEKQPDKPFQFERTRGVLMASLTTFRRTAELAAADESGPDLARLECFSCHHELRVPSWRQERHAERSPGRLRLELGCLPLLKATAGLVRGEVGIGEVDELIEESRQPFQQNLFGDPTEIVAFRAKVDTWTAGLETKLAAMPLDRSRVRDFLLSLLTEASTGKHDYDTARQLTGAIIVVADELQRSGEPRPWLTQLLGQLHKWSETGFALAANEDKQVEDRLQYQLETRALVYKPAVYQQAMAAIRESAERLQPD